MNKFLKLTFSFCACFSLIFSLNVVSQEVEEVVVEEIDIEEVDLGDLADIAAAAEAAAAIAEGVQEAVEEVVEDAQPEPEPVKQQTKIVTPPPVVQTLSHEHQYTPPEDDDFDDFDFVSDYDETVSTGVNNLLPDNTAKSSLSVGFVGIGGVAASWQRSSGRSPSQRRRRWGHHMSRS